ncbi:MAG TPA: penicillin acylase family protein [Longimicrobium sp.]|jgi:acyl-homoserine-lactone acylase|uniref:penicillin acylase family protein n=1 Tax=Longimicrobium sp. TaxID=2029185 RepID=UPI002ED9809D
MNRLLTSPARHVLALLVLSACAAPAPRAPAPASAAHAGGDLARWQARAQAVTITRDDWGIAHVRGRTDADAVFGMMYAQAEDDFNRVERNYLVSLGRLAEAEGEAAVWQDVRQRLFIDHDTLRAQYAASPAWLRSLMDAWADGLNFYLHTHPQVTPRAIRRFEPWMALSFSEGSIGADIERVSLRDLAAFYGTRQVAARQPVPDTGAFKEQGGSNGIAIAPPNTANGRALLLINPHTSFFFRAELHATSDEGLNAYGAATWGQFFIYQGFNDRLGWMHTTSGVDAVDEFLETVAERGGRHVYRYGAEERPVTTDTVTVSVRGADGAMGRRSLAVFRTHHGPVVREQDGRWVAVAMMNTPVEALSQSYLRTRARTLAEFRRALELRANSSNATVYADADGNIAYFHPQFIPRRDDRFDYTRPVDGSDPATDWRGLHALDEAPGVVNPATGWIQNTNNTPYSVSGESSPRPERFARYMDTYGENARGLHALQLLRGRRGWTLQGLIDAAYDPHMPGFDLVLPPLLRAYDALPAGDPRRARLAEPVAALRGWDRRWDAASVPTSLAIFYGTRLWGEHGGRAPGVAERGPTATTLHWAAATLTPEQHLEALVFAVERLEREFGSWRTPWGEINRFQRITGDVVHPFSDAGPSIPVGFTHGHWGSLASFAAAPRNGSRRWYGTSGNSFVAAVEFGRDSVRARAVTAGGESGDPRSRHFNDQAERYAAGRLRDVYFYPGQLRGHTERVYRPGQ